MATSVGLDIHARGVRAVEVARRGKSFRVTRYQEHVLPSRGGAPDPEELREALRKIFKSGFSKNQVVAGIEAGETVVREIAVPFKGDDQIRKVVKFEAEHHLHDCDADDVIVQYTKVGETKDASRLLIFAARKDDIGRRVEHARSVGVEPLAMGLDALAVYNAVRAAGILDEEAPCVLLHIGHRSTEMVAIEAGDVRALRSVRIGVDSIAQGLARDMDMGLDELSPRFESLAAGGTEGDLLVGPDESGRKETEKSHAELERDLFAQRRDEVVARLKREYARFTASLGRAAPSRIIAAGPGLKVAGLLDRLGERLGHSIEAFQPATAFSARLNGSAAADFDAGAAVAVGLALKGLGHDPLHVDFRQEELRVANKFDLLKGRLAVTVTLLFVALMGLAFYYLVRKNELMREVHDPMLTDAFRAFAEITAKYNTVVPENERIEPAAVEANGPKAEALERFVGQTRGMMNRLRRRFGGGQGVPEIRSALKTWNDIFTAIQSKHEEIGYVDIDSIDVQQDSVSLGLIVTGASAQAVIVRTLDELEALQGMEDQPPSFRAVPGTPYQRTRLEYEKPR